MASEEDPTLAGQKQSELNAEHEGGDAGTGAVLFTGFAPCAAIVSVNNRTCGSSAQIA